MMENKRFIGKVFRHFRILEPLGHGGMGLVFKALNTHLNKIVAIKMIAPGLALNEKLLNRFKTEALALARLENPHIVRILDLLEDQGQWFIVMEYIEGETLQQRLKTKRPLRLQEALDITRQILSALQHAHSAGIIHRDIKPSNILLTNDNTVKVTDFGLAKIQANSLVHTQHSAVGGTLYYMSPEQIRSLKETDHRTDIYSLGITIYQMITGRIPFDPHQTDFDIREAIVRRQFPKPSTFNPYLPAEINDLVMKAIAKDPDQRFQSAVEMLQEIDRLTDTLEGQLDRPVEMDSDIENEINYTDYPFNIQEDFSGESSVPSIPVKEQEAAPSAASNEPSGPLPPPSDNGLVSPSSSGKRKASAVNYKKRYGWGALVLLVLVAIIYFWVKISEQQAYVTISTQPAQAQVFINGQFQGRTPLTAFKISSGRIHILVQKKGFKNADTLIQLAGGKNYTFNFRLAAITPPPTAASHFAPAQKIKKQNFKPRINLSFTSQPVGAEIFINAVRLGVTPVSHTFPIGKQLLVKLKKQGFHTLKDTVYVSDKGKHHFEYLLIPKPVEVTVTVNVPSAQLIVDGRKTSISGKQKRLSLKPGMHVVAVIKKGFVKREKTIHLQANVPQNISFNLLPLKGQIAVLVLPWGDIYLDGQLKKRESNIRERFVLPAGKHILKVTHPVFGECTQTIEVRPDTTLSYVFNFKKLQTLRVLAFDETGHPQYARIIVDGKAIDQYTPGMIKLSLGSHEISVYKEGFTVVGQAQKVMVVPDKARVIKFQLRKNNAL